MRMNVVRRWVDSLRASLKIVGCATALGASMTASARETLYVFTWTDYTSPEVIDAFEKQYNARVVLNYFGTMGDMYARLQAGGDAQFDLVIPSSYYVPRLIHSGLVQPLDHSKLPNARNLLPVFADADYDPGLKYSMPYQWGSTGLVYDTRVFPKAPESWALLFDPKLNPDAPFSMQTDGNVMIAAACAYLGYGYTCQDKKQWIDAAHLLLKTRQRGNFTGFVDGAPVLSQVVRGVNRVGVTFSGDFVNQRNEDPEGFKHLAYMLPSEGAERWVDVMMIPKRAPHPDLALAFINFVMDAKQGAALSNYIYNASPNQASQPYLDDVLREAPAWPTDEEQQRLHMLPGLDGVPLQTFQQIWSEVRSR